jgi:hypothetical protein
MTLKTKARLVVFDLDGTLALTEHREGARV